MPVFSEYETVGEPVSTMEAHGRQSTIWRVRKTGSQDNQIYALKCFLPRRRESRGRETEDTLGNDGGLEFLQAIKEVKKAQSKGGRGLIPIHDFGTSDEGAWYVTDFFSRGSLKNWVEKKGKVDDAALRRVIYDVTSGCLALKRICGRSHGNLKAANVFLSGKPRPLRKTTFLIADAVPMPLTQQLDGGDRRAVGGLVHEVFEVQDLQAIGELILQLVEGRLIGSGYDYNYPIVQSAAWRNLGKQGEHWRELCNRLLDPNLSLEKVNLESLEREFRPSAVVSSMPVVLAAGAVICIAGGLLYWLSRPIQPQITSQPAGATCEVGSDAMFAVSGKGGKLAYQWWSNSVVIPDATGDHYRIPDVQTNQTGSAFSVVITNSVGSVTSQIATLTVNRRQQTITFEELPIHRVEDPPFNLNAQADSGLPVVYQSSDPNVATVSGNTVTIHRDGQTLLTASQFGDATYSSASPVAQALTVGTNPVPPLIVISPTNEVVSVGMDVTFSVTASGTSPLNYQWSKDGGAIPGASGANYKIPDVQTNYAGDYQVAITNMAGTTNSLVAKLTVNRLPQTIMFASLRTHRVGDQPFDLDAQASSGLPVVYQSSDPDVATVSGSTVTIHRDGKTLLTASQSGDATNSPANPVARWLIVGEVPPVIGIPPASQAVTVGTNVIFSVTASGTLPLNYQWHKDGNAIHGATSASYEIPEVQTNDAGDYLVVISNAAGAANSTVAKLTVNVPPAIMIPPTNQVVTAGADVTLSVTASGTSPLNYQWRKDGSAIPGATGANYEIPDAQTNNAGDYQVVISNMAGAISSQAAKLTVMTITIPPPIHSLFGIRDLDFVWADGLGPNKSGAYVAVNELSFEQYSNLLALANNTESVQNELSLSDPNLSDLNLPAAMSFAEAGTFLDSFNKSPVAKGKHFRLLTLAEYKLLAGLSSNTDNILSDAEINRLRSAGENIGDKYSGGKGAPVAINTGQPESNGLRQLMGNVAEWTAEGGVFGVSFERSTLSKRGRTITVSLANEPIGIRLVFVPGK